MTLRELIKGIKTIEITGNQNLTVNISGITFDSRKVGEGDVFVALKGSQNDGHRYLAEVLEKKPAAVIVEEWNTDLPDAGDTVVVVVKDSHLALGLAASNYFGNPSHKMTVIGVTGTNGKTSIATLIHRMSLSMGVRAGLLSTIANYIDEERVESTHTTPDPISINRLMARMADAGCRLVAMEVSSHAAHQKRIAGIKFKGGIFTNLTRDHLDYHGTFAAYRDAKKMFFDALDADAFALTNVDDSNHSYLTQNSKAKVFTYGLLRNADFRARIIEKSIGSTVFSINGKELAVPFTGTFNIYNLTAVYGAMVLAGFDAEETLVHLSAMRPVAGRFQTIRSDNGITAIIDYAHTPDALENVLEAISAVKGSDSKIFTVVGAGGNRDKGKRPLMGRIAAAGSYKVILTSDNPRDEEPEEIIEQMQENLDDTLMTKVLKVVDRRSAIAIAVELARAGDIVLVAGKGHENYQEIKGVKHHFDDVEEVKKIFENIK